jgi:hypothetical protein
MDLLPLILVAVVIAGMAYLGIRQNRESARNGPLRDEIAGRVCFETPLDHVNKLGTGGFDGGTRNYWISLRGPTKLIVSTDSFMISAPQALREFVFAGHESSIEFSQEPSRGITGITHDWIIISGQSGGRPVQLAIRRKDSLQEIWNALAGTGAALLRSPS